MGMTDAFGFPIAVNAASASPHEITLLNDTLDVCFLENIPDKIIGCRAYDSDKLDKTLEKERANLLIEMEELRKNAESRVCALENEVTTLRVEVTSLRDILGYPKKTQNGEDCYASRCSPNT